MAGRGREAVNFSPGIGDLGFCSGSTRSEAKGLRRLYMRLHIALSVPRARARGLRGAPPGCRAVGRRPPKCTGCEGRSLSRCRVPRGVFKVHSAVMEAGMCCTVLNAATGLVKEVVSSRNRNSLQALPGLNANGLPLASDDPQRQMTKSMRKRAWRFSRGLEGRNTYCRLGCHKNRAAAPAGEQELVEGGRASSSRKLCIDIYMYTYAYLCVHLLQRIHIQTYLYNVHV